MNADSRTADPESWKSTILAGLANYIDGGSIVAGAIALSLWAEQYNLSPNFVGLIGAYSANGISAGVGALIGGRLCDSFGRKRIYQYDMLFYAVGMLWLVFAARPWMILVGYVLVGLAVGADIPASWSLIAETAPRGQRGKHSGVAQVLWLLGPLVVVGMFLLCAPLGLLGARIVFAHLALLALVLTLLRSRMRESPMWMAAKLEAERAATGEVAEGTRLARLFKREHWKSIAFLVGMYGIWNLFAGTISFFFPYILRTVGGQDQVTVVMLQAGCAILGIGTTICVFMRLSDRINQRLLFGASILVQIVGVGLLAIFPLTLPVITISLFVSSFGSGFGAQAFFQLWSAELFPTLLRGFAQGITFAIVRIGLGVWSFFVPAMAVTRFTTVAWILMGFLVVSGIIGVVWGPKNAGKTLEQIERERDASATVDVTGSGVGSRAHRSVL
jgi:inositol transporter-like SP family MFS transporter